jgi:addiction module HigA family antidote
MAKLLPPVTPGEILREEFMVPLGLSANGLAEKLGVPANRISSILNGSRGVTADTALRLGRCFETSPEFWLNLQTHHDLEVTRRKSEKAIAKAVRPISREGRKVPGASALTAH